MDYDDGLAAFSIDSSIIGDRFNYKKRSKPQNNENTIALAEPKGK